ncbi:integrator complex subunit 7 [Zeugodacus cucurbitae]|uniref:integrator complex subunit 7 n=1 Tax=Zeugodacus cucurbitae TaxID=28588 RepID=UPI00059682F6|nr:integrator complex subunit 7 [Zeugodacus cucurbitae]
MSSLSGVRVNLFNENFLNESEQDANSVLTELDKGLRSAKLGVQCEAIVRFPRLFEKYPFPILINSSFLKLAEFFWNGSNLLRFWVLRVCQQSENHLDKILNIEAFVKRIFMVIHSNDPVARALTLRTLGAVSRVIPEKQQVHHAIRRALDSHDTVEVEAAIYASGQFAAQSRSFAISMCAKISDMIESLQIPVPMKLQLIPVLRHMHHDSNTSTLVKDLCLNLLPKYPAESFVVAILDTLTQLSIRTLTGVPDQVKLLLDFLQDKRKPVRAQVLKSLTQLADPQCVHAWPKNTMSELIVKAQGCEDSREQYLYLNILLKLCDCPLTCHAFLNEEQESVTELCLTCICLDDYATASQAMSILAALMTYSGGDKQITSNIMEIVNIHMEGLIFCMVGEKENERELKKILCCGIKIASVNTEFGTDFVNMLADLITEEVEYPPRNAEMMCDALGALGSHFQLRKFAVKPLCTDEPMDIDDVQPSTSALVALSAQVKADAGGAANEDEDKSAVTCGEPTENPVLNRLLFILHKLNAIMDAGAKEDQLHTVEILASVALQSMIGCFIPKQVIECFERSCSKVNCWNQYRIARSASRFGQHYLAAHMFSKISQITVVDKLHFFLMGLAQMGKAECILNYGVEYEYMRDNYEQCAPLQANVQSEDKVTNTTTTALKQMPLMQRLESSINLYWQALASLRASSSPANPLTFQLEYLKLRAQFLQTLYMAVTVKNAQIIVPPPAIAGSLAQNSRDYLQKFGHVTNQLRKLVKALKSCEESYSRLYKSAFDADPVTLEFLEIAEYQCALFAHIVETICFATPSDPPTFLTTDQCPETRYFASCCHRMEQMQRNLPQEPSNAKTISNRHLEIILSEIELITKTPLCLPRYFFQVLQSTQIKLSVSPQPRSPGEPVLVQSGSNLVIKVEGVIQHYGKRRSMYRSVDAVQLTLTSQLVTPRPANETPKSATSDTVTLTQTVKPQRDFLTGSFLLPISSGGQWQVTLETYVIDENGITWCTGPKNSMLVRLLEDPAKAAAPTPSTSAQAGQTRRF